MTFILRLISDSSINLNGSNLFDLHQALYWYCHDNHEGQSDTLYSILSQSPYKPSPIETSAAVDPALLPFGNIFTSANAPYIYCAALLVASANDCDDSIHPQRIRAVEHLAFHYLVQYDDKSCRVYYVDVDLLVCKDLTQN
jgi:hypothetical protein